MKHFTKGKAMTTETLMSAAFSKAGLNSNEVQFRKDLARYLNNGGSTARVRELLDEIDELSREGHPILAGNGPGVAADPRQPYDAKGQFNRADKAKGALPVASPNASGEGHRYIAEKAMLGLPPAREPSQQQRDAVKQAMRQSATNSFERELTRTGQQWGNVYYRELDNMLLDADIAQAVKVHIGFLRGEQRYKQIKELMTPREFAIVVNRVRAKHAA